MTAPQAASHLTSYTLDRVYANRISLLVVAPSTSLKAGEPVLTIGWDWRILGADLFDVSLTVGLDPTPERLERVEFAVSGRFRLGDKPFSLPFKDFLRFNGPALLMPYARQILGTITAQGFYGPYYIQPINVVELMRQKNLDDTTGMRQIREREDIGVSFKLASELLQVPPAAEHAPKVGEGPSPTGAATSQSRRKAPIRKRKRK